MDAKISAKTDTKTTRRSKQGISHPFPEPPAPGAALEVASGVYWLRMPLPFALDHVNLWLLEDGAGWSAVDCGFALDETRQAWRQIFAGVMQGRPMRRLFVTHHHPDHLGLAAWLAGRWRAEIAMTAGEWRAARAAFEGVTTDPEAWIAFFRSHGLAETHDATIRSRGPTYRRGVPELPDAVQHMAEGDELAIDGRSWRVIVGQGHAPEHASLYCRELNVLIAGDQILPRITPNISVRHYEPEGDPLGVYLASLEKFRALPAGTFVLPSHDLPFVGLSARLDGLLRHHEARLKTVLAACAEPISAADLIPYLFKRKLDAHGLSFAMGESLAHAQYLAHRGRLARVTGADGIFRFVRKERG